MVTPDADNTQDRTGDGRTRLEDFRDLSRKILGFAGVRDTLSAFLPEVLRLLLEYSGCDEVELGLLDSGQLIRWRGSWREKRFFMCDVVRPDPGSSQSQTGLDRVRKLILEGRGERSGACFSRGGSFYVEDARNILPFRIGKRESSREPPISLGQYTSIAIIPLPAGLEIVGILQIADLNGRKCTTDKVGFFENLAQTLGILLVNQRAQYALRERLKELTCLYGITKVIFARDLPPDRVLEEIVRLIPPAWQYPEAASARAMIDGRSYHTCWFSGTGGVLSAPVISGNKVIGNVEVGYHKPVPKADEGPFLKEERALIDAIARQIGLFWERSKAEEDKILLSNQLRHADRLATIGQFTAGLAHDLNEPLGSILGFAQLAKKTSGLPEQADRDLDKIIESVLHSREIVRKLLAFGRPVPQRISGVNVNKALDDVMSLFEGRCGKSGISVVRKLDPGLPEIRADQVQINQVIVNLVSNAVLAMPGGGTLELATSVDSGSVILAVTDTGIGMDPPTLERIFEPFFTTRDLSEGTGLGLNVAMGIIRSYGGTINVSSTKGAGSRFEVDIPVSGEVEDPEHGCKPA